MKSTSQHLLVNCIKYKIHNHNRTVKIAHPKIISLMPMHFPFPQAADMPI